MSIVAVHGPSTFGSQAMIANTSGTAYATVDPANGLIWTLHPADKSQVAANYDWVYTGSGSPASPQANTMEPVITFAAGAHTITLTLNSVAQATFVVTAAAGTGPTTGLMMAPGGGDEESEGEGEFDPADYTVAEVTEYAEANPDQLDDLIAAEEAGKNRSTLLSHLEGLRNA